MSKSTFMAIFAVAILCGAAAFFVLSDSDDKNNDQDEPDTPVEAGYPRTVEDLKGNIVTLDKKPERVVIQGIEYASYLGQDVMNRIIWAPEPRWAEDKELVDIWDMNDVCTMNGRFITMAENIIAKNPDMVIAGDSMTSESDRAEFKDLLNKAGIKVFFFTHQSNLFNNSKECLDVNLMPIAKIFAEEERVNHLYDVINEKTDFLNGVLEKNGDTGLDVYVAGGAGKSRGLFLGSSPETYHPLNYLKDNVHNIMYDITDKEYLKMSDFETLYQWEKDNGPIDRIWISQPCYKNFLELWNDDKGKFMALDAFQNDNVYVIADWFPRAYMCIGDALLLGEHLFPADFKDKSAMDMVKEMMIEFYGGEENAERMYNVITSDQEEITGHSEWFFKLDTSKL